VPQLYGTTHTVLGHVLPRQGIVGRFADSDRPDSIERLIDEKSAREPTLAAELRGLTLRPNLAAGNAATLFFRNWVGFLAESVTACRVERSGGLGLSAVK
jgi:hypothetical protein